MARFSWLLLSFVITLPAMAAEDSGVAESEGKHIANLRQVTLGLPRAGEGYFSPDGTRIVYQAYPLGYPFYQIYTQRH